MEDDEEDDDEEDDDFHFPLEDSPSLGDTVNYCPRCMRVTIHYLYPLHLKCALCRHEHSRNLRRSRNGNC